MRAAAVFLLSTILLSAQDSAEVITRVLPITPAVEDKSFEWTPALSQSMRLLSVQHVIRIGGQSKTRREMGGPFLRDWLDSVKGTSGWRDGDSVFTNYVGHPLQGAMTGFIQIQNDPRGRRLEFGDEGYWRSRLKALTWSAIYSVQFEIGPLSESTVGNVGMRKGTSGYVDHVMTPAGGIVLLVSEDALDRYLIRKWESRTASPRMRGFYRVALNPSRAFANVLRGKAPWHRDGRPLTY